MVENSWLPHGDRRSAKWDARFMDLASLIATWSKDPSTRVGSVIVDPGTREILGVGYNGFPRGVADLPERYLDKPTKYSMIVHAEANALMSATAAIGGCTLYATKSPCTECVKLIVQSRVTEVVSPAPDTAGKWGVDAQFATQMLREAGVDIVHLDPAPSGFTTSAPDMQITSQTELAWRAWRGAISYACASEVETECLEAFNLWLEKNIK